MFHEPHPRGPLELEGTVTHPQGQAMVEAARQSLSDEDFNALMQETGGAPPSPAQLVNLVEARRNGSRT